MATVTAGSAAPIRQTATPGGYAELLAIAVPLMLSAGTQSLMHIVDRIFLTGLSSAALAASLPAGILFWSCLSLPFGTASYINAFVAQYEGAGQRDRVIASVAQGVWFAIFAGLLLMGFAPFSQAIFAMIGHEARIAALEAEYFYWLSLGAIPALLSATLSSFFSGRGQTRVVLAVNIASVAANILLDYALIFGNWGLPAWGITGAAIATNLANCLACVVYAGLMLRPSIERQYHVLRNLSLDFDLLARLLKFGLPSGLQMFVDVAGFTVFMLIIGLIGEAELAATNIAFNLNTLAFIPVIGIGIAVSTLVGQRIGEGRPDLAEASTWRAFSLGGAYMVVFGVIYMVLPDLLLWPYAASANRESFDGIRSTVIVLLRFVTLYSFFDAMAIIFGSAIRSAGDTRFSMLATGSCAWFLMVLPTWLVWKWYRPDLILSWAFCSAYVIALGFIMLARFRQGRWRSMKIIEHTAAEPGYEPANAGETHVIGTAFAGAVCESPQADV